MYTFKSMGDMSPPMVGSTPMHQILNRR